jgi:transposase InsO family protein
VPGVGPVIARTLIAGLPELGRLGRKRGRGQGTPLSLGQNPNELWCADYKGEFLLGNKKYCYPLTVTDHASRYLLLCEALESTRQELAFTTFERLFKECGLPQGIRSDNGVPFASANALFNLSRLSVWWLRLGIQIERIKPGNPQQNGRHERMNLTLKRKPPGHPARTACNSRLPSTASCRSSTLSARMRR